MKLLPALPLLLAATGCRPSAETRPGPAGPPATDAGRVIVEEVVSRDGKAAALRETRRFEVRTSIRREGDALLVDAEIFDTAGGDSAANVRYGVPMDLDGWTWHDGLADGSPVVDRTRTQGVYPLAVVTPAGPGDGRAVAIAPDTPCVFAAGCSRRDGLFVEAKIGFSSLTRPPSRARLRFALFPVDGAWGMRSALERYDRLFPEAGGRRAAGEGLWLFHGNADGVPNPADFAFHELGELGEALRKGTTADGILDSDAVRRERGLGIGLFPYVIPGQREVGFLDRVKGEERASRDAGRLTEDPVRKPGAEEVYFDARYTTAEARAVLDGATEKNVPPSMRLGGLDRFRAAVRASFLVGADGEVVVVPRETPWSKKTVTFPVDPNPFLDGDGASGNVGAAILEQCRAYAEAPFDGIYVDSLWRWGNFLNYRRGHFPRARHVLTYGPDGRPALDNALEHLTFLEELGKELHARGRTVFGNGVRPGRFWHARRLDILGSEMGAAPPETFAFNRAAAGRKPYLALNHNLGRNESADRAFLARCFLYGIYGGGDADYFRSAAFAHAKEGYAKFLPIQRAMNRLGWEPVTQARSVTPGVLVERFGCAPEVGFTLYDPSTRSHEVDLDVALARLGLPADRLTATDPVSGRPVETAPGEGGILHLRGIPLNSDGIGAVRIGGRKAS